MPKSAVVSHWPHSENAPAGELHNGKQRRRGPVCNAARRHDLVKCRLGLR
jgi:hypothetical protein